MVWLPDGEKIESTNVRDGQTDRQTPRDGKGCTYRLHRAAKTNVCTLYLKKQSQRFFSIILRIYQDTTAVAAPTKPAKQYLLVCLTRSTDVELSPHHKSGSFM